MSLYILQSLPPRGFAESAEFAHTLVALNMKRCPACNADVIEWHSFCPECNLNIPSYGLKDRPVSEYRSKVDRSWTTWVLIAGLFSGSGLLAKTIDWRELGHLLQGHTMSAEDVAKFNLSANEKLARRRVVHNRNAETGIASTTSTDNVAFPLPSPTIQLTVTQPAALNSIASDRDPLQTRQLAPARPEVAPDVEIQQIEAAPTDKTGIVTINCPVPARVYINGQYSGITPRTVHLNAGEHQVRLVAEGYLEWSSLVRVRNRQQMGVLASMTRAE